MNTEREAGAAVSLYILAGWLSILQAVIILPRVGVEFFAESMSLSGSGIFQLITGFHVAGRLMGIFVLLMFRRLLNERHSFHKADKPIYALICCYAAAALIGAAGLVLNRHIDFMPILVIISVLSSLVSIVYAVSLLKLDSNLSGLLKPYVYTTIAAAVFGATLVLIEYGLPISMVSLILLGMILIRAESEPEYL